MTDYQYTTEAINKYYSGADQWKVISNSNITPENVESALGQIQGVNVVKSDSGKVLSYNFKAAENVTSAADQAINSNIAPNIKSFNVPANTAIDSANKISFASGLSKVGNFVTGEIVPALAATAAGITLGKTIDKLLYNANPDFWDEHGMSTLNPDVWGDIIGTDTTGGKILNAILGTTPEGKTQAYMDENAFAYMALYLQNKGAFDAGPGEIYENDAIKSLGLSSAFDFPLKLAPNICQVSTDGDFNSNHAWSNTFIMRAVEGTKSIMVKKWPGIWPNPRQSGFIAVVSEKPISKAVGLTEAYPHDPWPTGLLNPIPDLKYDLSPITVNNKTFYCYAIGNEFIVPVVGPINTPKNYYEINKVLYAVLYGDYVEGSSAIEGIGKQENAKTPDLSNAKTVQETLDALKAQYPELFEQAVTQNVVQPDGSTVTYTYVPVAMPEVDPQGNPVSSTSTQAAPQIDPATATEPLLNLITQLINQDPAQTPPDTGAGTTPIVVPPTGSASALYAIYNPTLAQINSFGAWLWSDSFIDQIKKLFNDPMQAIIGLHKVYANPVTGGAQSIKVGYLDSGVSANVVSNQYTTIDCGTVNLSESFYNVFDYAPYTEVNLYLPFIGIVGLDVADVMRSSIHIIYHVDVLSGACLAEVKVVRDGAGGTLYQYTGNASVTLPISSGSYIGMISAVAGIAGGIAGTIASGGSALPILASAAGSMLNARTKVEHSGGFSGNAGAMGGKIPYLIISRPQVEMANDFQKFIGYPSNVTTTLSTCTGFVNVLECHLENINATSSELMEIETLLKGGIIV